MSYTNIGKNPLDKIADIAGALAQGRKKAEQRKREFERKIKKATPKNLANAALDSAASKIGVTRGSCKHKGVKRGTVCGSCGSKLL